jgi:hypothetical protein
MSSKALADRFLAEGACLPIPRELAVLQSGRLAARSAQAFQYEDEATSSRPLGQACV